MEGSKGTKVLYNTRTSAIPYESMKLDNIELSLDLIERAARYSSQATFIIKQI